MTAAKAIVAAVGTVVVALTAALADEVLSLDEVGQLAAVVITGAAAVWAVWRVPNQPTGVDGEAGLATSELLLAVIAVCCVIGIFLGWGLAN